MLHSTISYSVFVVLSGIAIQMKIIVNGYIWDSSSILFLHVSMQAARQETYVSFVCV